MPPPMPALRPEVDAVPTRHKGKPLFLLYDRSGLSPAQLAISPVVMFVASQLDGETSVLEIQDRFAREAGGEILPSAEVEKILAALDEAMFLRSDRFDAYYAQSCREFLENPVRPPYSAGAAYSDKPEELAKHLDEMLRNAPAPEEPAPASAAGARRSAPLGAIIPHIDYARGATGYGQVYRELAAREPPEAIVVMGTAHHPMQNRFAVLDKDFAVPGGTVRNARETTAAILGACRRRSSRSRPW